MTLKLDLDVNVKTFSLTSTKKVDTRDIENFQNTNGKKYRRRDGIGQNAGRKKCGGFFFKFFSFHFFVIIHFQNHKSSNCGVEKGAEIDFSQFLESISLKKILKNLDNFFPGNSMYS